MNGRKWKVGELAEATGVTVRTLHHFDAIGLLSPTERSSGGHRLYTTDDVRRLYQILALRQIGMPLADISSSLESGGDELAALAGRQLDRVDQQLMQLRQLRRRLADLIRAVRASREPSTELLLKVVEATMEAGSLTPEQLAQAKARHQQPGFAEAFTRWQREGAEISQQLAAHLGQGSDPADPAVQQLAQRWQGVMREMVDGDPVGLSMIYAKIESKGPEAATRGILSTDVWEYLKRAFAVGFGAPR